MNLEKDDYIAEQLCIDYTQKSENTGIIQIFVALVFFQSFYSHISNHALFTLSLSTIVISLVITLIIIKKYSHESFNQNNLLKGNDVSTLIAGLGWGASGILIVHTEQAITKDILMLFIVLIALSLGSMISLAYRKKTHFIFNVTVLIPFIFFSILDY